jgi:predicted dehydrogenase
MAAEADTGGDLRTRFQAGVIGCGRIGAGQDADSQAVGVYSHAGAFVRCAATELAAVCDRDPARARRCARRWGGAPYGEVDDMLEAQALDMVSVCTPDDTHAAVLRRVIESGSVRLVIAEKPLAASAEEARSILRLAGRRGVRILVNYSRRFAPSHRRLQAFIEAGGIGSVQAVSGYYTKGIRHNGTHWLDLARMLAGEINEVTGRANRSAPGGPGDPTLDVLLRFSGGATGVLLGADASRFSVFEMDILGTAGRVRVLQDGRVFECCRVVPDPDFAGYRALRRSPGPRGGLRDVLLRVVEDGVRCLRTGSEPLCTGADGLAVLRLAEAALDSARTGRTVRLDRKGWRDR